MGFYLGTSKISKVNVTLEKGATNFQDKEFTPNGIDTQIKPDSEYNALSSVLVKGDTNLSPENIRYGATIYGVEGEFTRSASPGYYQASSSDILERHAAWAMGTEVLGSMPDNDAISATLTDTVTSYTVPEGYHNGSGTVTHTTVNIPDPTITVSSAGLITASGNWTKGYTTDSSYSKTQQLTTKAGTTITPTTSEQTIANAGVYTTGALKVGAIPSNYKDTSDATAAATDILSTKTAYVGGAKITGSLIVQNYYTGSSEPSSSLGANGDLYLVVNG